MFFVWQPDANRQPVIEFSESKMENEV